MATTGKTQKRSAARRSSKPAARTVRHSRSGQTQSATARKARKKAKVVKAGAAKRATKKVARQIPRAERSYAIKPKPATTAPVVELAVPEVVVGAAAVQGEVPAGGE